MKIVFFSSDNNPSSGAFRAEVNLIEDLMSFGHDIILVLPYRGKGKEYAKKKNIKCKHIFSVYWVSFYPKTFFDTFFYVITYPINIFAKLRTKRFLKKENFDLAVVNTAWNGLGGEIALKLNIPLIWHLREILEAQFRAFYSEKKSIPIMKEAYKLLPVSHAVYNHYLKYFPKEKMEVIYDGINSKIFYHEHSTLFKDKTIHILTVGRVNKYKGYVYMIKALNELSEYDFDFTIVGHYYSNYKNYLLSLATNIRDRIHFVGVSNHVSSYYQKADLFLMASIGEAFGLVIAEALLEGLVVACSRSDGGLEIVKDEENGYFFTPGDYLDMKKTLIHIFTHQDEAKEKAKHGQERVLKYFRQDINSKEIEKIYLEAIKEKGKNND